MDGGQGQGKRKRAEEKSTEGTSTSSFISSEATTVDSDQYDVFLSFRGSDTRKTFTDCLYHNLLEVGIVPSGVFRDNNSIPIGEEFGPKILNAIAQSKISILIISQNYASSKWCLRELIHIMGRKKRTSHKVLPIFYKVAPSDVRNLTGNFGNAFRLSHKHFDEKDIQEGQQALREVSFLHGWESEKVFNGHDGELIKDVVRTVQSELRKYFKLNVPKQLVGLDGQLKEIMDWIHNPSVNARMIGIYGMGGIGKTTLAKCVYNKVSDEFVQASFLPNIREKATQHQGIENLQSQLIYDILRSKINVPRTDDGIYIIENGFKGKKVLIVLDDIDDKRQLHALAGERNWFMAGSIIIVTTRNQAILDQSDFKVDYKYELKEMDEVHSLLLFNKHAFRMNHSLRDFEGVSRDIISTMGGLPLALEVVGSYLYKKRKKTWEEVCNRLKSQPDREVEKILKISYDALKDGQKEIFLDIACFFIGKRSKFAIYMWEDYGLDPNEGIEELTLRCLIKIDDDGIFEMHDQLRDLGRGIFRQKLVESGKSWEYHYEGFPKALINLMGRPQFLDSLGAASSGHSQQLLSEVRWLQWKFIVNHASTANLHLPKLSVLELEDSKITEDWQGWISLMASKRLKVLHIGACHNLRRTPDLSTFMQLKMLKLWYCKELDHLHPSIGKLKGLVSLDLTNCKRLQELPEEVGELKDLEELLLDNSGIIKIPPSIASLRKLKKLSAKECYSLREIPSSIGDLQNLQLLDLSDSRIERLPSEIGDLSSLEILELHDTWIVDLPESLRNLSSLQSLDLTDCYKLRSLLGLPSSLQSLYLNSCKELRLLPEFPSSLQSLDLNSCKELRSLPELPSSLQSLHLNSCKELRSLPKLPSSLESLHLNSCKELRSLPELPFSLESLHLNSCEELRLLPELPSSLQSLHLNNCEELRSLPELPSSLKYLLLRDCNKLQLVPKLPSLQRFDLTGCKELQSLLGFHSSLQSLKLNSCKELRSLPELPSSLQSLHLNSCKELRSLPELPSSLQSLHLNSCEELRSLPEIPSSLKYLLLWDCNKLQSVPKLPSLQRFDLTGCKELQSLLGFHSSLQSLKLNNCKELRSLPELPSSLQSLHLNSCKELRSLPELPSSLKYLLLRDCYKLQSVPKLPSLQRFNLIGCKELQSLLGFHSSLQSLKLNSCKELQSLPKLPSSLKYLLLWDCNKLRSIPELPSSLQRFDLTGCKELQSLPELPSSLQHLDLTGSNQLRSMPKLPSGLTLLWVTCQSLGRPQLFSLIHLEYLHLEVSHLLEDIRELSSITLKLCFEEWDKLTSLWLSGLTHLEELSIKKCGSIKTLGLSGFIHLKRLCIEHCDSLVEIEGCYNLESLEVIFLYFCKCLKKFKAFRCSNLIEIQGLDDAKSLEELDFTGCKSMETLPDLTGFEKLQSLTVQDCKKLAHLRGLEMLNLTYLDISGCDSLEAIPNLSGTHIDRNYKLHPRFMF